MIVMKKHLPRRTVLRGLGVSLALPLLDSMVPALAATRTTAANPVKRFGAVYVPMGANMPEWTPPGVGPLTLSPILQPLAALQDRLVVMTGLDSLQAFTDDGNGAALHMTCQGAWLTQARVRREAQGVNGVGAGVSMDQVVARELEASTQLGSLEIGLEPANAIGRCEQDYSCVYASTVSWRTPTTPLPVEHLPRGVFERLFGVMDSTDAKARAAYVRKNRSILDAVSGEAARLNGKVGPSDRQKVTEYLDAVRDVERRLQRVEEQGGKDLPVIEQPQGVPETYEAYATLMFDLMLLAYQADLTRVVTVMMGREQSQRTYTEIGIYEPHHPFSHHQNNPEKLGMQKKLNIFHLRLLAAFLEKMRATPDGDGSLLDHTLLLYGSGMSDSNFHSCRTLPTLVVAGPTFGIKGGRHLRYPFGTPLSNLELTLLNRMGINHVDKFGDSTGELTDV